MHEADCVGANRPHVACMLSPEDAQRIKPYVSNASGPVFALKGLPEEVIAVLFAYYSRSKNGLRENLSALLGDKEIDVEDAVGDMDGTSFASAKERARAFHQKWTVGYGHGSVAEHAIIHLGIEDVSILASKAIEDMRLGSFTEKSTRFVTWSNQAFVTPPEIPLGLGKIYETACVGLFDAYASMLPIVETAILARSPRKDGQSESAHAAMVRARALDVVRGILPASAKTSIGLTANARALSGHLCKMLGSPLEEVRHIAGDMHDAAVTVTPTLLRHVLPAPADGPKHARTILHEQVRRVMGGVSDFLGIFEDMPSVVTIHADMDAALRIATMLSYEQSETPWTATATAHAVKETFAAEAICKDSLLARPRHAPAARAFEAARITFELEMDFGAYRDLQRHRMLSPATQRLGCGIGYDVPELIKELGFEGKYRKALDDASSAWYALVDDCGPAAQYVVPLAYKIRTLWHMNLRELIHVVELRTGPQGHSSYRRIAQAMYHAARGIFPWLDGALRVDLNDYEMAR